MAEENKRPEYHLLLGNAFEVFEKMDHFDLDDTNRTEYAELENDHYIQTSKLIDFIKLHGQTLKNQLKADTKG